ncbi:MAG: hypothetical protein HGA67_01495 [Candidatus Yonathbacteria bacterium]|nr:hypothetical protein [Candidatus Yonathbacteria bacterium]
MQLLALRGESNGGVCFVLARNSEPRPAALCKMRALGAFYLVTAGRFSQRTAWLAPASPKPVEETGEGW